MLATACRLFRRPAWLLATALASTPGLAAEPYRLQAGDAIDFALIGGTPVQRRIMIGPDGQVSIPMGGMVPAAGLTIDELRRAVVEKLQTVSYPAGSDAQGGTLWSVVYPESVLVEIGEYRPVYVSGDVLTPSSQPFRAGMTVAQAVAVAGGASPYRSRQDHSLERVGLDEEVANARTEAFKAGLRIARIQAELQGRDAPDFSAVSEGGLDPALAAEFRSLELQQFTARREDLRKSRDNITAGIASAQERFDYLRQSQVNLEAETRNYEDEVKRVEELLRKGLTPIDRLTSAQRGVFLVSTRSLSTLADVAEVQRQLGDLRRALEKLDDDARLENLDALQAASTLAAGAASRLETLQRKASVIGGVGKGEGTLRYTIARRDGERLTHGEAGLDTILMPGDLVEVTLDDPALRDAVVAAAPIEPATAPVSATAQLDAAANAPQDRRAAIPVPAPAVR